MPVRSQLVPAAPVLPLVFRDVFFEGMQRPMRCREGRVQEKRLIRSRRVIDHLNGLVRNGICVVEIGRIGSDVMIILKQRERMEKRTRANQCPKVLVKPSLSRDGMASITG